MKMYHGSPKNLKILKSGKSGLFLTPHKGIACLFIPDSSKVFKIKNYHNLYTDYDAWYFENSKLKHILKSFIIYHNYSEFKDYSGTSEGYIYTIETSNLKLFDYEKNPNSDRELVYFGNDIIYLNKEKIQVKWKTEFNKKLLKKYGEVKFKK